jgi:hypothetical protein
MKLEKYAARTKAKRNAYKILFETPNERDLRIADREVIKIYHK